MPTVYFAVVFKKNCMFLFIFINIYLPLMFSVQAGCESHYEGCGQVPPRDRLELRLHGVSFSQEAVGN